MINTLQKRILDLAIRAGELMMKNGAEVYRVEDTILRICKACKIANADVFVTLTGIFVSISSEENDGSATVSTSIKRVHNASIDLGKISKLNSFAREFTTTDLSIEEGALVLEEIDKDPPYPLYLRLGSAGVVCAFFSLIFGGIVIDAFMAFWIGIGSFLLNTFLIKLSTNYFLKGFICTAMATFVCLLLTDINMIKDYGPVIIGVLMIFVPGFSITTAMRDFLSGDMLAGLARLTEALAIAISLASGAGLVIQLWNNIGGMQL